jgi:hypothetical protein
MGYHIVSDIAPYSIELYSARGNEIYCEETETEIWNELHNLVLKDEDFTFKGWTDSGYDSLTKKGKIEGTILTKDNFEVCIVNTSEYANIGNYAMVALSKDKKSLKEFIKDLNLNNPEIIEMDTVQKQV